MGSWTRVWKKMGVAISMEITSKTGANNPASFTLSCRLSNRRKKENKNVRIDMNKLRKKLT